MSPWIRQKFDFHDLQRIMFRLLERVGIFHGLTQQDLLELLENAEKCTFEAGETILRQGSTGAYLYVIIAGTAVVTLQAGSGPTRELAVLEAGDSFGEMSLVDREVRSANVIADSSCLLLRLSENVCWQKPATSARIFRNIAHILSGRLREMDEAYVLGRKKG